MSTKTLKVRIKDKHRNQLNKMAGAVNFVWNYCNELSSRNIKEKYKFMTGYDFHPYTKGAGRELGIHSQTLQQIAAEYATRRKQFKKQRLKWRKTGGTEKSTGWVPTGTGAVKYKNGQLHHNGMHIGLWDSFNLGKYKIRSGSFTEDSRGRWYFNAVVEFKPKQSSGNGSVGIDLGCKTAATDSNGEKVVGREYRKLEQKLGVAQRAKKKDRVRAIHDKIKNRRKDTLHKYSTKLVKENALVVVGNVSSSKLVKTKMAKSVLDAGWGQLKSMLEYKCNHAGSEFLEVNEAYSTQVCSGCGCISSTSPKGRADLGIREWTCAESGCGETHDRDINAAKNILAVGHYRLAGGIP
jgi:IS605 OrfB family transposase